MTYLWWPCAVDAQFQQVVASLACLVWDDLSTRCAPFQVLYFHAGGQRWVTIERLHTQRPPNSAHYTIFDQMQKGPNVTCCKGLPCTMNGFQRRVKMQLLEWLTMWGSLNCCAFTHEEGWDACERSPAPHFRDFDHPTIWEWWFRGEWQIRIRRFKRGLQLKCSKLLPSTVSHPLLPPRCIYTLKEVNMKQ